MGSDERISLYVMAGVRTAPHFMEEFRDALARRLTEAAGPVENAELLFPYGDWSRPLWRQAAEVWHDIRLSLGRLERSIGGQGVLRAVGEPPAGEKLLLVGHSGGGTAAVHAAAMLQERCPGQQVLVVLIGAPRSPVPPPLASFTAYCYACRRDGAARDPVCRLGRWQTRRPAAGPAGRGGESTRAPGGRSCPPGTMLPLPIAGGHPDYFRTRPVNAAGRSNLDQTLDAVWSFIQASWF